MAENSRIREPVARVACNACRSKKLRCDTNRPICGTCIKTSRVCAYDTRYLNETRGDALRRENKELRRQIDELKAQRNDDSGESSRQRDVHVPDDVHEMGSKATSLTGGRSDKEFDRMSRVSSVYSTHFNFRGRSEVYSEVSGVGAWQDDGAAQKTASSSTLHDTQLSQSTGGHAIYAAPGKRERRGSADESAATRVLDALIRSDDERSALLLAGLRVGSSWTELAAQVGNSTDDREYSMSQTTRSELDERNSHSGRLTKYDDFDSSTTLTSTNTKMNSDSKSSLPLWLTSAFDKSYWIRHKQDQNKHNMAVLMRQAGRGSEHITFARSWNHHFGNMDLASAIDANNQSLMQQELQKGNLSAPRWAVRLMNYHEAYDPFSKAIFDILQDGGNADNAEDFCGPHVYVEALIEEAVFNIAPRLSQHLARLVKGIKSDDSGPSGLQYALMVSWWALLKWSLSPSKESYDDIPVFLRPSPWQYFVMHGHIIDFVMPMPHREYLCRTTNPDMSWVTEGCQTVECDWPSNITCFERDPRSGQIAMSAECKAQVLRIDNFSMGPSLRAHLLNADSFYRIRI